MTVAEKEFASLLQCSLSALRIPCGSECGHSATERLARPSALEERHAKNVRYARDDTPCHPSGIPCLRHRLRRCGADSVPRILKPKDFQHRARHLDWELRRRRPNWIARIEIDVRSLRFHDSLTDVARGHSSAGPIFRGVDQARFDAIGQRVANLTDYGVHTKQLNAVGSCPLEDLLRPSSMTL